MYNKHSLSRGIHLNRLKKYKIKQWQITTFNIPNQRMSSSKLKYSSG